jgi:chromosome segregation ATPase
MAKYRRRAAQLENEKAALVNDAQEIANKHSELAEWQAINEERKTRIEELHDALKAENERYNNVVANKNAEIDRLNNKIDALYSDIAVMRNKEAEMRDKIDNLSSENTALTIFRCDKVGCAERKPPFAYQVPTVQQ